MIVFFIHFSLYQGLEWIVQQLNGRKWKAKLKTDEHISIANPTLSKPCMSVIHANSIIFTKKRNRTSIVQWMNSSKRKKKKRKTNKIPFHLLSVHNIILFICLQQKKRITSWKIVLILYKHCRFTQRNQCKLSIKINCGFFKLKIN